jgi:hypothetical protein
MSLLHVVDRKYVSMRHQHKYNAWGVKSNMMHDHVQLNHINPYEPLIQIFPNFDRSEKYLPQLRKMEVKYGFECLEEMNNFIHRHFLRFRMDLELKFWEFSRLEFGRI